MEPDNYHVPQKNIGHITPIQVLKDWHKKQPELFKKKIYDLSGLDSAQEPLLQRGHDGWRGYFCGDHEKRPVWS